MIFNSLSPAPPDAILGLTVAFRNDPHPGKVNLGVGVYQDDTGVTPVLKSVKAAEDRMLVAEITKSYMPIGGAPEYRRHVQELILGADCPAVSENRVRTAHTPGGTGGLRLGAEFLKGLRPDVTVWVSDPTWANHPGIFSAAGFKVDSYTYYNAATKGLDFEGLCASLEKIPAGDIVLLHVCCHNPTGVDLSVDQWRQVAEIAARRGWVPYLDFAYQGLGDDLERDRAGLRAMAEHVPEWLVSSSFSKNFGLYRERTGALSLCSATSAGADAAYSHLERTIRVLYSNPPAHGGLIVSTILEDAQLRAMWEAEVQAMRDRIRTVRNELVDRLASLGADVDFSYIRHQKGMFSFSGLTDAQVAFLKDEKHIYIVKGGRINVAGITSANIDYLCASMMESLKK